MPLQDSLARLRLIRRQGFLLVIAIVIPCLLLVGLSVRMLVQERELADTRAADDRRQLVGQVRQHLLTYLERVKLEALSGRASPAAGRPAIKTNDALALVAVVDGDRLVLPWDRRPGPDAVATTATTSAFAETIQTGQHEEFVTHRFDIAVDLYRHAVVLAPAPAQKATAQLALARTLAKAGRTMEASDAFAKLLDQPLAVVDDQGMPFALYAAGRLLASPRPTVPSEQSVEGAILTLLRQATEDPSTSPATLYMVSELAGRLAPGTSATDPSSGGDLRRLVADRTHDIEQAEALRNAFPTLAAATASSVSAAATGTDPIWLPFGSNNGLWLVSMTPSLAGTEHLLIGVRSASALTAFNERSQSDPNASGVDVALSLRSEGEPLGRGFPGLAVVLPAPGPPTGQGMLQRTFYFGALFLVLSVALSGGYLFWRDVQRDVRLSAMRSQFVSSVSHELKTPLTAIRMFAETLRMGRAPSPADGDEYLDTIVNESERLTRLINNVLDFSKIEQGRKVYRLEPHALGAIVRSAARTMQYPLAQQGFDLRVSIDDNVPDVPSDPDALEQALLNLLNNAMKYSGEGRVIDLALRRDGGEAIVAVTDRGFGIPVAEHAKIFEKFYRVQSTEQQSIAGTGLGLTLVDHTARAHGGRVTVRSAPGEGSTFSIVLPFDAVPTPHSPIASLRSQES